YVAVSFVQTAKDVIKVKKIIKNAQNPARIITKIETKAAIKELEEIIHESDAVMVARGDLAVELGQEEVPIIQRDIISLARRHNTPVIIATQMLESMIVNPEPTRAEVNDVATGVLSEVDAVMLSAETAAGAHPIKAVAMMNKIIKRTEKYLHESTAEYVLPELTHTDDFTSAIDAAAAVIVNQLKAKIVFDQTATGKTAYRLAAYRPKAILVGVSDSQTVCRQLSLTWGTESFYLEQITDMHNKAYRALIRDLLHKHEIDNNARIVLITGKHPGKAGHTNTIHISQAKEYFED
ncbi:MAG: pyruvate kinase, partial [Patescibacteria group bacterium]|nr:pyruvate kinase [Patescibacteria group bacterium]